MKTYITRTAESEVLRLVGTFPAVVIVGPRQVGKTSLARRIAERLERPSVYLDLELPDDFGKLSNPSLFLEKLSNQTVIIDEVQRRPALFPILRALIDRQREPGRFILLGSASPELIRDTSESLAGRVAYFELQPFSYQETAQVSDYQSHWLRGGFPESLLAVDEQSSLDWRENFVQTYLERDLPLLGLRAEPILVRRLWTMLAHLSGGLLNLETLAGSLGITAPTVRRYIDFLEAAYLIRRLPPWFANISKRLVKTPKVYIRDTGVLHTLLNIASLQKLQGHPSLGASWETYVLQEIAAKLPPRHEIAFYRTQDGTEADFVIVNAGLPETLVEVKYSSTPKVSKGFYIAQQDLGVQRGMVVCPTEQGYPLSENTSVIGFKEIDKLWLK